MDKLIKLYNEIQALTWTECVKQKCTYFSCCTPDACKMVSAYARLRYGIDLDYNGQSFIVDGKGCSVPTYLRPLCSVHQCKAEFLGDEYWSLRDRIGKLEVEFGCLNY